MRSRPGRARLALEQPGCLHAGMDLYRGRRSSRRSSPSELVADCFAHAREIRAVDMRASPYDLSGLGYPPIAVETPEGRAEYVRHQRVFAERGAVLRERLLVALDELARRDRPRRGDDDGRPPAGTGRRMRRGAASA